MKGELKNSAAPVKPPLSQFSISTLIQDTSPGIMLSVSLLNKYKKE
jgi:hypothetical protein